MPDDVKEIKKVLLYLINEVEKVLQKKPFFFVNEHDLSAYLYSQLLEIQELELPFIMKRNGFDHSCYRVHLEYPRYSIENKNLKSVGKYGLAILRRDNTVEKPFPNDEFTKKPVWVGFEIKLHWNIGENTVGKRLLDEKKAFVKKDNGFERRPADYGVVFHLNIAKKKECRFEAIERKIKEFQKEIRRSKVFAVYMESYIRLKNPRTLAVLPDGTPLSAF